MEKDTKKLVLIADRENVRIDIWLSENIGELSRTSIKRLINNELISVNGNYIKANYKLKTGDNIQLTIPEKEKLEIKPENITLNIIYEDDYILIINKPKGMVVHPAPGHFSGTLVNALVKHCGKNLSNIGGDERPGIVHRLDKDTSGIIMVAKTNEVHGALSYDFKYRKIKRNYVALAKGVIKKDEGKITLPIRRHPINRKKMTVDKKNGREAITNFKVLERFKNVTYVELGLETGRTHQIRVHLSHMGHPILGDEIYGRKNSNNKWGIKGQALHGKSLGFNHPVKGVYMEFEAEPPKDFKLLLEKCR